jgi:4-alpha-glucanotransferase
MIGKRGSGILLHLTSLPSPYGIGDLGPEAYRFADFLFQSDQSYWQVLPLNPTEKAFGNSPYSSFSAYAGDVFLISPDLLIEDGLLTRDEIYPIPSFPPGLCDYGQVIEYKLRLLDFAYERLKIENRSRDEYEGFCRLNSYWLEDFALFVVIKRHSGRRPWNEWSKGLKDRDPASLEAFKQRHKEEIEKEKFMQYLFFKQWHRLRDYCNAKGIKLIGDIPIYVCYDSVDVWANTDIFKLNGEKKPTFVAGVPPDYFSATGQLWGNPVYDWKALKASGYKWWLQRIEHNLSLFNIVRIDHFRGFVGYWEVPAKEKTAVNGRWVKAPADDFFTALTRRFPDLPLLAEDLGIITEDVKETMKRFGFPGMKVLLFAFGEDNPKHPYLPHNFTPRCVAYTGTHDNNTTRGWFENEATSEDKQRLFKYLEHEVSADEINWELIHLAMESVANTVIFPLQDVLGLGKDARMNFPGKLNGNWEWRLLPEQITASLAHKLSEATKTYGRALAGKP